MGNWKFVLTLLFFVAVGSAQPIKVSIDSISTDNSNSLRRIYTISYHIKNATSHPVSFFLNPDKLIPNAASSMTLFTVYKIYQNGILQDMDGPFIERGFPGYFDNFNSPEAKEFFRKRHEKYLFDHAAMLENYHKNGGKSTDESWITQNQNLLKSKMTLQPGETQHFKIETSWNKIRTVNNGDIEYYLNENDRFEFELILDLKKKLSKDQLSETEYAQIKNDPDFLEGVFTSNKIKIDFGE